MSEQKKQSAIRITGHGTAAVVDVPVPEVRPDQMLVRVVAVAHNPSDWMILDWSPNVGATEGCDYAGVVTQVGEDVGGLFAVGDRVAGFAHGGNSENHEDGAFADYIAADPHLAARIPDGVSFEEAAPLGLGVVTAAQYLYQALGLPLPRLDGSPGESKGQEKGGETPFNLLVYGGSTATGMLAIQLAKLSGATVLTTCSARSAPSVEALGADAVFDYNDPDCISKIKSHVRASAAGCLNLILDCIGDDAAARFCTRCFVPSAGEKCIYASLLYPPLPEEERGFEVEQKFMLAYTAFGYGFTMSGREYRLSEENRDFMRGFFRDYVGRLWEGGKLRLMPVEARNGGWEDVVEGIAEVRGGGGRGRKLVWRVG